MERHQRQEEVKFWQVEEHGTLDLLRATYVTHAFTRHTHDTFAIGVIERGAEQFYYRRANHVAPAQSIVLINPGEMHTGQAYTEAGWSYRMFYPEAGLLQRAASEVAGRERGIPYFPEPVINDPQIVQHMRNLHTTLETTHSALERESRLLWTFAQLVMRHAENRSTLQPLGKEQMAVLRAREYLEAHYTDNISLEELAQVVNLSSFHFLRLFRTAVGLPPHTYLSQIRVARAKTLLHLGLSIADVAAETGLVDQSHLNRQFKRITGITPGQYVQAIQGNSKNIQDLRF